jgi:hypothetical protein
METRLDRIEKAIEALLLGISEFRESQKTTDSQILQLKESEQKTDEQIRRTDAKLDRIGKQLADQGLVQGEVAEELFFRNLRSLFRTRNVKFEKVRRNVRKKGEGEYDIVAVNEGKVLVVEVKNKLEKRMVDEFVEERLPRFKELFPEYARFRVEGGVGALVVKEDVGRYAEKAGLYVLTQTDEGGAVLLNRDDFQPKEFS